MKRVIALSFALVLMCGAFVGATISAEATNEELVVEHPENTVIVAEDVAEETPAVAPEAEIEILCSDTYYFAPAE